MSNPMTLTPEEALCEALEPWPMAALDADRVISRLEPRGYRLTPIEINEAAVEKAAERAFKERYSQSILPWFRAEWIQNSRAAIVAYLEGAK